jgi:hypothetical protein
MSNDELSITAAPDPLSNAKEYGLSTKFSRRTLLTTGGCYLALKAVEPQLNWLFASSTPSRLVAPSCFASSRTAYPPLLERFIDKLDPAADVFPAEVYVVELESILAVWSVALCKTVHDAKAISDNLSEDLVASSFHPSETLALRVTMPLRTERRLFLSGETTRRERFLNSWTEYVAQYAALQLVEFEIYSIHIVDESPLRVERRFISIWLGRVKMERGSSGLARGLFRGRKATLGIGWW